MDSVTSRAYAKINLTLDCVGKRPDGYHEIRSVMQSISIYDTVKISKTISGGITAVCGNIPRFHNVAVKAAEAFFNEAGIDEKNRHLHIEIDKRIPVAAGLGGGSTDAAAVINLLDRLYETGFDRPRLIKTALKAGADVPFCLFGNTSLVEGIGEQLVPICDMPELCLLIVKPFHKGSTSEMYSRLDSLDSDKQTSPTTDLFLDSLKNGSIPETCKTFGNCFSPLWECETTNALRMITAKHKAYNFTLTGSGPTFFSVFENEQAAKGCFSSIKHHFSEIYLAKTVNTL